jgi:hypothetical protein
MVRVRVSGAGASMFTVAKPLKLSPKIVSCVNTDNYLRKLNRTQTFTFYRKVNDLACFVLSKRF